MTDLNITNEVKLINSSFWVLIVLIASVFLLAILSSNKVTEVLLILIVYILPILGAGFACVGVVLSIFKFGRKPWKLAVSHTAQAVLMLLVFLFYLMIVNSALH
ncbi:MAG: hypothetical protein ACI9SP_004536 [Arenicella sp.]|jgi:hypothetical protein